MAAWLAFSCQGFLEGLEKGAFFEIHGFKLRNHETKIQHSTLEPWLMLCVLYRYHFVKALFFSWLGMSRFELCC